jgi:hypothetical protein
MMIVAATPTTQSVIGTIAIHIATFNPYLKPLHMALGPLVSFV